jgi:hypothetical protein
MTMKPMVGERLTLTFDTREDVRVEFRGVHLATTNLRVPGAAEHLAAVVAHKLRQLAPDPDTVDSELRDRGTVPSVYVTDPDEVPF